MSAVEMFAAQITTTLSNIDALDFTTSVDDVLIALERELEMLDRQQKSVGQSHQTLNLTNCADLPRSCAARSRWTKP